jgi:hypothetical protein
MFDEHARDFVIWVEHSCSYGPAVCHLESSTQAWNELKDPLGRLLQRLRFDSMYYVAYIKLDRPTVFRTRSPAMAGNG